MSEAQTPTERATARRRRFLTKVGPHMQVSEIRTVNVPAQPGVMAHQDFLVATACGKDDMAVTLVTRNPERVRCPDCLVNMQNEVLP